MPTTLELLIPFQRLFDRDIFVAGLSFEPFSFGELDPGLFPDAVFGQGVRNILELGCARNAVDFLSFGSGLFFFLPQVELVWLGLVFVDGESLAEKLARLLHYLRPVRVL